MISNFYFNQGVNDKLCSQSHPLNRSVENPQGIYGQKVVFKFSRRIKRRTDFASIQSKVKGDHNQIRDLMTMGKLSGKDRNESRMEDHSNRQVTHQIDLEEGEDEVVLTNRSPSK